MIKYINNGEILPRFYGVAWTDWYRNRAVCLPLGVNLVAAAARNMYTSLRHAGRMVRSNPRDAYEQGLRAGLAQAQRDRAGVEPTRPWPRG